MAKKTTEPDVSFRVFEDRPTKDEIVSEIERFFALLRACEVEEAGAAIAHAKKDWWPRQVRSLWQDLAVPWLEEQGEEADLDDDRSWRELSWLEKIGVELDGEFELDPEDDEFSVNVVYDGAVTDVSGDFRIVEKDGGWVLERQILHVA
jgi:hypothetical protein